MHRNLAVLPVGILALTLLGCQLVEALLPGGAGQLPMDRLCGTYQVVATDEQEVTADILEQTRTIIEERVNATGVAEPIVVTQGADRILVELPGVDDEGEIRALIGTTGVLEFMPVPAALQGSVAEGPLPEAMLDVEPLFTGVEIASAAIAQDPTTREIVVDLQLKDTGSRLFDEYAEEHYGEQFAIVLDDQVMSAPVIQATRFGGRAQISGGPGGFPVDEANSLVTVLKFGSLPLEIREVGFSTCEASGSAQETPLSSSPELDHPAPAPSSAAALVEATRMRASAREDG